MTPRAFLILIAVILTVVSGSIDLVAQTSAPRSIHVAGWTISGSLRLRFEDWDFFKAPLPITPTVMAHPCFASLSAASSGLKTGCSSSISRG